MNSRNYVTEQDLARLRELLAGPRDQGKALFLIPCCSSKRDEGSEQNWHDIYLDPAKNQFQSLNASRTRLIDFYSALSSQDAARYYAKIGSGEGTKARQTRAWQKNLRTRESRTVPAIDRYTGNLYSEIDHSILDQLRSGKLDNVLIVSALMGIVAPSDEIPDYELVMSDKDPDEKRVFEFWRSAFAEGHIKETLTTRLSGFSAIFCLMSATTGYVQSVAELLSEFPTFVIRSGERGQKNILRGWGRVLNAALTEGMSSSEDVRRLAIEYGCELLPLSEVGVKKLNPSRQQKTINSGNLYLEKRDIERGKRMSQADQIRAFVLEHYIEPARKRGDKTISINAGEVDKRMGLGRVPNVNNALVGQKLEEEGGVSLVRITGIRGSTTCTYTY